MHHSTHAQHVCRPHVSRPGEQPCHRLPGLGLVFGSKHFGGALHASQSTEIGKTQHGHRRSLLCLRRGWAAGGRPGSSTLPHSSRRARALLFITAAPRHWQVPLSGLRATSSRKGESNTSWLRLSTCLQTLNRISRLAHVPWMLQIFDCSETHTKKFPKPKRNHHLYIYTRKPLCNSLPLLSVWLLKARFSASFGKASCQQIANKVVAHYTCAILKYTAECAKFPYLAKQPFCFQDLWPPIFRSQSSFVSTRACRPRRHQPGLLQLQLYLEFTKKKKKEEKTENHTNAKTKMSWSTVTCHLMSAESREGAVAILSYRR